MPCLPPPPPLIVRSGTWSEHEMTPSKAMALVSVWRGAQISFWCWKTRAHIGTHWLGKTLPASPATSENIYACYSRDLSLPMERHNSAKPEIHDLLKKHVLYKPRDLEFLLHLWDQFLQVGQIHQQVQFLQEGQFVPFPPVGVVLKIIWDWH